MDRVLRVSPLRPPRGVVAGLCLARGTQRHPDRRIGEHELFFVRRGRLPIAEAGVDLETPAGETLILWPHRRHHGTADIPAGAEFYWLHFALDAPARGPALAVPQRARPARPERLMELLHRYLDDQHSGRLTPAASSALILLMLSEIAEQRPVAEAADAGAAARAEAHIARRFHQPIGTASIARALGCNPDHLGRVYRRAYGRTIMDAIGARRVAEAKRLLLDGGAATIPAIAARCGCPSATWFRRLFKRVVGTSPEAYRRAHARAAINS